MVIHAGAAGTGSSPKQGEIELLDPTSTNGVVLDSAGKLAKTGSGSVTADAFSGILPINNGGTGNGTTVSPHYFFENSSGSDMAPAFVQPSCSDLSGAAASCSTDTTNASNIMTGTLSAALLPSTAAVNGAEAGLAQMTSITSTPLATAGGASGDMYIVSLYIVQDGHAMGCSPLGNVAMTITFTDPSGTMQSFTSPTLTFSNSVVGTEVSSAKPVFVKSGDTVNFSTNYSNGTSCTGTNTYAYSVSATKVQ